MNTPDACRDEWHWEAFHLDLPTLQSLSVRYATLKRSHKNANAFGDSLTRCPQLCDVTTYKFRALTGRNCVVLPECTKLDLHCAEGRASLDILHVPKLTWLGVQAAELGKLYMRDFAGATAADALALNKKWALSFARAPPKRARPTKEFDAALDAYVSAHEGKAQGGGAKGKKKEQEKPRPALPILTINS
jgi:hypothetical protein